MQSRRFSTRCKGREFKPDERLSSAVSSAAIYGQATKRIVQTLSANSAIRTSSELMVLMGANSTPKLDWQTESNRPGNQHSNSGKKFVVFTGGEPLLQLDRPLIDAVHARDFEIAVETNGTVAAPSGLDWICVSPKAGTKLIQNTGNELKLVFPQAGAPPEEFQRLAFRHFFLQPMDGPHRKANTDKALRYCLGNPVWRLSLQTHKFVGIR